MFSILYPPFSHNSFQFSYDMHEIVLDVICFIENMPKIEEICINMGKFLCKNLKLKELLLVFWLLDTIMHNTASSHYFVFFSSTSRKITSCSSVEQEEEVTKKKCIQRFKG